MKIGLKDGDIFIHPQQADSLSQSAHFEQQVTKIKYQKVLTDRRPHRTYYWKKITASLAKRKADICVE